MDPLSQPPHFERRMRRKQMKLGIFLPSPITIFYIFFNF